MAAIQRKLEFKVRKSSRIQARAKFEGKKELKECNSEIGQQVSPRKRHGNGKIT